MKKIKTALISLSDKTNLRQLLKILQSYKIKIISSGGTHKAIKKLGFNSLDISSFTKFPEILNGRVKTLHPKLYAGILSKRNNKSHMRQLKINNFSEIDLVIVNFYPFEKTLKKTKSEDKIIEKIDIGGPSLVRAAAKNFKYVTVISSANDYIKLYDELKNNSGFTSYEFRKKMSLRAFEETSYYDSKVSNYFSKAKKSEFSNKMTISGKKIEDFRYGENPHQKGAIYSTDLSENQVNQLSGKKLSFNNYNDLYSALYISKSFPKNLGTVIIKHGNPSGVSINKNKLKSFKLALDCDPVSAYGGIISCNFKITKTVATHIKKRFFEIIIGNGFERNALQILKKKKNLRIIDSSKINFRNEKQIISKGNSFLIQTPDDKIFKEENFKVVSKKKPNKLVMKNLIFAFNICRFVKSNAIVITKDFTTVGIGSGQTSRVDSCDIAINKMRSSILKLNNNNIYAASDAFFPFVDGVEKLVLAGVTAIIQPEGSIRDKDIIKFANKVGIILVFSKSRHFKH